MGGGMIRDFQPMDRGSPVSSSVIRVAEASQQIRLDVSAVT